MTKTEVYSGPSTLGLLGVAFVVLKLLHIIGIVIVATCVKNVK